MSKGNMLLGHARGKVGDLVFSRSNGQQVTRARAAVVKNPQTVTQMIQRIILNTVAQAYSRMSEITDHSFEGVEKGQKSMSFFMKKNMEILRLNVAQSYDADGEYTASAFTEIGGTYLSINPYVIASGSLPSVQTGQNTSAVQATIPAITQTGAGLTYQAVIDDLGVEPGDQLTFIILGANAQREATFHFCRVILMPQGADGQSLPLSTPFIANGAINMPNAYNEGSFKFGDSAAGLTFQVGNLVQVGAAVIVSRKKADGVWMRSNTTIAVNDNAEVFTNYNSMQWCLDTFEEGAIQAKSSRYLNNARKVAAVSNAGTISLKTVGTEDTPGEAVTLVGLSTQHVTGSYKIGDNTFQLDADMPAALDDKGGIHLVMCLNSHIKSYNKVLKDSQASSLDGSAGNPTWISLTPTTPSDALSNAVAVWSDDDTQSALEAASVQWFVKNGVSIGCFIPSY